MVIDEIDFKILELLQEDGRLSHTAIGKEINLSGPSVYARVQRLERDGLIKGYAALLDAAKIGRELVAFVRVAVLSPVEYDKAFEQFVQNEPQIIECHDVDGEDSYFLKIRTEAPATLRTLVAQIRSVPGVTRTVTSIALKTIKELPVAGLLITGK